MKKILLLILPVIAAVSGVVVVAPAVFPQPAGLRAGAVFRLWFRHSLRVDLAELSA